MPPAVPRCIVKASVARPSLVAPEKDAPVDRSTTPEVSTTSAVSVQTTMVSTNTSNMPHMPCTTGSLTSEAECTMTEEPRPASLENTPRLKPQVMACMMTYPPTPPAAAFMENAPLKMEANAGSICW